MSSYENRDLYKVLYPAFRFGLDRKFDRTVEGIEYIPEGAAIFTPNHTRMVDSPLVAASYTQETGRPMRFLAKKEYFEGDGLDGKGKLGRSVKWLMEHSGMIPVDRESRNPRSFQTLQADALDRLAHGDAIAIHPEGTRSEGGRLSKFKSGAARIALEATVPLVPVGVMYTDYSNGRKTHVDITFGEPIMPIEYNKPPYSLVPGVRPKAELLTQELENRVADLTGMEQTGAFAQLRKFRKLSREADSRE